MAVMICQHPDCDEPATHLASRVDAGREYFYGCEADAAEWASDRPAEVSFFGEGSTIPAEVVLAIFPPQTERRDRDQ